MTEKTEEVTEEVTEVTEVEITEPTEGDISLSDMFSDSEAERNNSS